MRDCAGCGILTLALATEAAAEPYSGFPFALFGKFQKSLEVFFPSVFGYDVVTSGSNPHGTISGYIHEVILLQLASFVTFIFGQP